MQGKCLIAVLSLQPAIAMNFDSHIHLTGEKTKAPGSISAGSEIWELAYFWFLPCSEPSLLSSGQSKVPTPLFSRS